MSDQLQPRPSQDRSSVISDGVLASMIATVLFAAGGGLVSQQAPEQASLQMSFDEFKVGKLSALHIRVSNGSDVAFNVQLAPPADKLVRHVYSPPVEEAAVNWQGQIAKGKEMSGLLIYEDARTKSSFAGVQSMITATYDDRNPATGAMEPRPGEIRTPDELSVSRTLISIFLFLLPTLAAGVCLQIYRLRKRLKHGWVACRSSRKKVQ